jgi:hypothetical protein
MDKLERLKIAFDSQTEYLARLTNVDFKLFIGYVTLQLAFAGWMRSGLQGNTLSFIHVGLLLVDITIAVTTLVLLHKNHDRRNEEIEKLHNICEALGYCNPGEFLPDKALFGPKTRSRPSLNWYFFAIFAIWLGVSLVLVGPVLSH